MAELEFNFCPNSRVVETIAPEEPSIKDFNGWDYAPKPVLPYRPMYKITLEGLRWRFYSDGRLDYETDPETNAGLLEKFYSTHRKFKPFHFQHEWMGMMELRFQNPVSVPKAVPNSGGLVEPIEVMAILNNPTYREW